jgi:antirestriction protein ArdC
MGEHRSPEDYYSTLFHEYSTLFHELAHSTGAESRLARARHHRAGARGPRVRQPLLRDRGTDRPVRRGHAAGRDRDRHREGVRQLHRVHASWRGTITADKKLIISAAAGGQKAADLIKEPSRELEKTVDRDAVEQASLGVPEPRQPEVAEPVLDVEPEMA